MSAAVSIAASTFDVGPLSWVRGEIEYSFNEARNQLDKIAADAGDAKAVRSLATQLHQVSGALSMVGLGAASRFNEELEKLGQTFDPAAQALQTPPAERIAMAKRAMVAISAYLDSLMAGESDKPMRMAALYVAVNRVRGANDVAESDLFSPDLSVSIPPPEGSSPVTVPPEGIKQRRSIYQAGLLKMLRDRNMAGGSSDMQKAVVAIELVQTHSPSRTFWYVAAAFFDALADPDAGSTAVALFGKIDQQIRLLIDGIHDVPEKLFRDLLLIIGKSTAQTGRMQKIRTLYRLDELLSVPDAAQLQVGQADDAQQAILRELRELMLTQKDNWLKFTSGNRTALEPFAKQGEALASLSARQGNAQLTQLFQALSAVGDNLRQSGIPPNESQGLEVATALLFIDSTLENYFRLPSDFAMQADTVISRVQGEMAGAPISAQSLAASAAVDGMTKRAQENLLVFQVGQEVQVNLQMIESVLDSYFRDPAKVAGLSTLAPLFVQIHGALSMLEKDDAAALSKILSARVTAFSNNETSGDGDKAEEVAEGVSALGLYITALQQGQSSPRDVLLPALIRFGLAEKSQSFEQTKSPVNANDLDVSKQKVLALYDEWKQNPLQPGMREQLRESVLSLRQRAEIVASTDTIKQCDEVLSSIDDSFDPDRTGIKQAISEIAPENPAEAPTAATVQLVDAPEAEVDQELLDIFLEEAEEVIGTIRDSLVTLKQDSHDVEAQTTIRRSYHTLKGSGRMVGLTDLGEVGWQCEQVMNKWVKEEKTPTPGLISFIEISSNSFATWVEGLKQNAHTHVDGAEIIRYAEALKHDQEPDFAVEGISGIMNLPAEVAAEAKVETAAPETPVEAIPDLPFAIVTEQALAAAATSPTATQGLSLDDIFTSLAEPVASPASAVTPDAPLLPIAIPIAELPLESESQVPEFAAPAGQLVPPVAAEPAVPEPATTAPPVFDIFDELPNLNLEEPVKEAAHALEMPLETVIAVPEDIRVGDNTVSAFLFGIYLGEADQHAAALEAEMSALESNPQLAVSAAFMRAAHTLHSSSRTTNFTPIADLAHPLEKWLQAAMESPPEFDAERLQVTRRAVSALGNMVLSLHARQMPDSQPEIIDALNRLRENLQAAKRSGEISSSPLAALAENAPQPQQTAAEALAEWPVEQVVATEPQINEPQPAMVAVTDVIPPAVPAVQTTLPVMEAQADAAVTAKPAQPAFESGRDRRSLEDDLDTDLLPIFLEEAGELLPQIGNSLRAWRSKPEDHAPVIELARHLHTLKGSSRMAGLMRLGALSHSLETKVMAMDAETTPPRAKFDDIEGALDRFSADIETLSKGGSLSAPIELPVINDMPDALPAPMAKLAAARAEVVAEGERQEGKERQALLRVNANLIDRFVNEAGELAIARSRIDQEMTIFKRSLQELSDNIGRMKTQLREIEIQAESQIQSRQKEAEQTGEQFDPLEFDRFSRTQELTRFMAESLNDVVTMHQSLQNNLDEADAALRQQGRLNRDLQQGLMGVRLVPLGNLQDRFYRLIRQTAKELGKKANLEFRGARVEIDRSVLEKIIAPLEHLLRNAVAHGLESPEQRVASGKDEIGEIQMDAQQVGNEIVLILSDDGAGLNFERIRAKARDQGLIEPNAEMTEQQLTQLIFMAGFSTAAEVTEVSGRGVGMDVVRNEIVSLGGRIEITSAAGKGTTFTISLPLTLAVSQAVLVAVGETQFAIPAVMIEQVQEYKGKRYEPLLEMSEIEWNGNKYPLRSMEALLGGKPKVSALRKAMVILAKSGQQRAAVQVDEIIGNREIVVKPIGPQLARLAGVTGATIMGSGQIILIMNPVQLVFRDIATVNVEGEPITASATEAAMQANPAKAFAAPGVVTEAPAPVASQSLAQTIAESGDGETAPVAIMASAVPLVMVVDDSLTVRKITSRMLTRERFEVATAKDGMDGLQQLEDIQPALILLDVEMPRMDGFEFARNVRMDPRFAHIPIIMITSRTADKHRNRALEIGVNEYMGKPYQEDQLMALVRQYTKHPAQ